MKNLLTSYYRRKITEAWGNPKLVAEESYNSFIPYSIRTYWVDEGTGDEAREEYYLDEHYPPYKRGLDIGILVGQMQFLGPNAFLEKLNGLLVSTFHDAIFLDDDDVGHRMKLD